MRREIHEVARKKLDISVDSAELDLACVERAGNRAALRAGIRKIEFRRDAFRKQIEVCGQHNT